MRSKLKAFAVAALAAALVMAPATAGAATYGKSGGGGGGTPSFGQDTKLFINNSAASPVTALELVAALTTTTAGSEASQWTISLLTAGAQVTAMQIGPTQTLFPAGSAGNPSVSFVAHTTSGMSYDSSGFQGLSFTAGGNELLKISGALNATILAGPGNAGNLFFGTPQTESIKRSGLGLIFSANSTELFHISSTGISVFGATTVAQQTGGAATAGASYTSTEQGMINRMYTALRAYGWLN